MKRKFKILIMAISIVAMLFAFTVTSNAAVGESQDYQIYYDFSENLDFNETFFEEVAIDYDNNKTLHFLLIQGSSDGFIVDPSVLRDFCNFNNISNYDEFVNYLRDCYLEKIYDESGELIGYKNPELAERYYGFIEEGLAGAEFDDYFLEALNYSKITQEDVNEAIAKALKEGNLNPNNYLVYIPSDATVADVAEGTEESFVAQELVEGSFSYFIVYLNGGHMEKIVVANALEFQEFCKKHEITDLGSLMTKVSELQEIVTYDNYEAYEWLNSLSVWSESLFDFFYNYDPLTQEEYEAELNAEKLAGAEEYKSSEEYINTINLAKESGIDEYKASDEYASLLNSKYNEGHISGTAAGITAYKSSTEYKKALSAEYDEGYDSGFEDGENTFDFAPLIVGIVFLGAIAITLVFINKKRKKKYRR